ncbi:class I SAM-dependent methyltransferase [Algoriphagus aestuariicola]|uniref:Class I SAM-dependent methyltransferase n=1 Tax=Algoriphagus aestuariicola TaxID=1852016 RepID=A0ABS3BNT8_9BACT|nr:class I SAM-dependent methyltransferase [Algoriphagus aestuariicola]MBN7800957.1 class I SAM-dependent methyltransferase [Algoriphagus aestuariicola]
MTEDFLPIPPFYSKIQQATLESGFSMASDLSTGSLLRTLAATKPKGNFLELGTGTGLSTSWILDGMDSGSSLVSIDFDEAFLSIARKFLGDDTRLTLELIDGEKWVESNREQTFDFIFADTWHGKYLLLDEVLEMLSPGGLYIVDDMLPQENWPEGHAAKAENFIKKLESMPNLTITKLNWSTGIIIATRKW